MGRDDEASRMSLLNEPAKRLPNARKTSAKRLSNPVISFFSISEEQNHHGI
jgi:hypothetical protein